MPDHRAEQILAQVKTLLLAGPTDAGAKVERDKTTPHQDSDFSVGNAALNVVMGADSPLGEDGASNMAFLDSGLMVHVDLHVKAAPTSIPSTALNQLRLQVHKVLMAGERRQGLAFVIDTIPAGAGQPTLQSDFEIVEHKQRTSWLITYRSSITDPSA